MERPLSWTNRELELDMILAGRMRECPLIAEYSILDAIKAVSGDGIASVFVARR